MILGMVKVAITPRMLKLTKSSAKVNPRISNLPDKLNLIFKGILG